MFFADLHLHSTYSDGSLSIRELVDLMGQNGVGAIAITDHLCEEKTFLGKAARLMSKTLTKSTFPKYLEEIRREAIRAEREYGMLVIPGVEITKNSFSHRDSSHILALDIHSYIQPDLSLEQLLDAIHAQGALAIAAHPVNTGHVEHQTHQLWSMREELKDRIDAWEVASGRILFKEVEASGLPLIANSDLHHPQQLESWKTVFSGEKTVSAIKEAIIRQELSFEYFESATATSKKSGGRKRSFRPPQMPGLGLKPRYL